MFPCFVHYDNVFEILDILELALSQNNHEVQIYKFTGGKWEKTCTLDEHVQRVNGIDWAPNSNRIVTCGAVWRLPSTTKIIQ